MLTKVKKQKDGEIVIEGTGASIMDQAFSDFIEKSDSQYKTITMPNKPRSDSANERTDKILDELNDLEFDESPKAGEEYKVQTISSLYTDSRGMLLQPKKRKEYRYSKDLSVVPENLSPISSRVSMSMSQRSFLSESRKSRGRTNKGCCSTGDNDDEVNKPCHRFYCNIY